MRFDGPTRSIPQANNPGFMVSWARVEYPPKLPPMTAIFPASAILRSTAQRTASTWSSIIFPPHSRLPALRNALPNPAEERKLTLKAA